MTTCSHTMQRKVGDSMQQKDSMCVCVCVCACKTKQRESERAKERRREGALEQENCILHPIATKLQKVGLNTN